MANPFITNSDVEEFAGHTLFSITVSVSAVILQFDGDLSIAIHHGFKVKDGREHWIFENGLPDSAAYIFRFLSKEVSLGRLDDRFGMTLGFPGEKSIQILAGETGYESYVINNRSGAIPVY